MTAVQLLCLRWLCRHLSKGAEQIKKDQAAALATLQKKIDAAKVGKPTTSRAASVQ